jgi:hypothetical protein
VVLDLKFLRRACCSRGRNFKSTTLEHDAEMREPIFGKDHARTTGSPVWHRVPEPSSAAARRRIKSVNASNDRADCGSNIFVAWNM